MKHQVSTLDGPLLDAAVALAMGRLVVKDEPRWPRGDYQRLRKEFGGQHVVRWYARSGPNADGPETDEVGGWEPISNWGSPSTDWRMGGAIIEREHIGIEGRDRNGRPISEWVARIQLPLQFGPTPLVAAMRAFVVAKLGPEVDLPDVAQEKAA